MSVTATDSLQGQDQPQDINISIRNLESETDVSETITQEPQSLEGYRRMRVILVQTAAGLKPPSGGYRGNYAMLNALQAHDHTTAQLCWAFQRDVRSAIAEIQAAGQQVDCHPDRVRFQLPNGKEASVKQWNLVNVHGIRCIALDAAAMIKLLPNEVQMEGTAEWLKTGQLPSRIAPYVKYMMQQIKDFNPTHVMFNDALSSKMTDELYPSGNKVFRVQITHTMEQLPQGPYAGGIPGSASTPEEAILWTKLDGVITVSGAVQKYAKEYMNLETAMIPNHPWVYKDKDSNKWPRRRMNFAKQRVAMINPAHVKGYSIFLEMAKRNKCDDNSLEFIAYKGWGSTDAIVAELRAEGVRVFDEERDMEPVYDSISVLVMPSLWQEAWGVVATEAQLRGIVVMSSDVGGLLEAKRWSHPIIPVNPIDGTKRDDDGNYVIPPQDGEPWFTELKALLEDKERYYAMADQAYYVTRKWVQSFDIREHEKYLLSLEK